ncbi:hypothetical protein VTP01DRAFT_7543 [Rhizomucor pusillus]|uniref:uncharacterized protein n=1 Tax=Rhizomucor pusillus TaxID=4840 RepID=UPI003743E955
MAETVTQHFSEESYQHHAPWRKLLWVKQSYPDNYVDSTFLEELQKNVNVQTYSYWNMVYESGIITQHISSVVIFIAVFIYLQTYTLSATRLTWISSTLTAASYVFWDAFIMNRAKKHVVFNRKIVAKSTIFFFGTLWGLSPILKTLTSQTSDDTIWALTVCCFLANILFHDYVSQTRASLRIPGSLSTNAAIFASVLLASRLDTNFDVFSLLSFAVEWFALFPIFRRYLQEISPKVQISLTLSMLSLSVFLFLRISKAVVFIYLIGFCFITFVCPYWLIFIQKYKNEIHGPWDEARPKLQKSKRILVRKRTTP